MDGLVPRGQGWPGAAARSNPTFLIIISFDEAFLLAEKVGFEPTCPCGQPHFECGALRPLRYFSVNNALSMTRTGRSRLERRHGWQGAGMDECPCSPKTLSSHVLTFLQDGEKGLTRIILLTSVK